METLIISIFLSILGLNLGSLIAEIYSIMFAFFGFMGPSIVLLHRTYKLLKEKDKEH